MGFPSLSSLIYSRVVCPWGYRPQLSLQSHVEITSRLGLAPGKKGRLFALSFHLYKLRDNTSTFLSWNYKKASNMSPLGSLPCCLISMLFSAIPAEHTKLALLCGPLPVGHSGTLSTSSSSQPLDIRIHAPTCPKLDSPAFPQKCACVPGCVCMHTGTRVCVCKTCF